MKKNGGTGPGEIIQQYWKKALTFLMLHSAMYWMHVLLVQVSRKCKAKHYTGEKIDWMVFKI